MHPVSQFKSQMKNPAQRRYLSRFFPSMLAYVLFFSVADYIFHRHHLTGVAAVGLAILPAIAIVASIVVVGLYIAEEQDEFQRMLFIRSILWGVGLTLAFTTTQGFLELFLPVQHFPLYAVYPLFWLINGLAQGVHQWYYGGCRRE
jgi:hypothetical protein